MRQKMISNEINILRDTFRRLIRRKANTNLGKLIDKTHPADLALLFRFFNEIEQDILFSIMKPSEHTGEFLGELDESIIKRLIENETAEHAAELIQFTTSNDKTSILNILDEESSQAILDLLKSEEQEELEEIMGYPEDSAGSLMYTDVFTLHENTIAKDAIDALQDHESSEMVFYLYVIDDDNILVGVISLRDLVTTPKNTRLKDMMIRSLQSVRAETDQEEVARIVSQYNYLAVPVVDKEGQLFGIVTVDEIVDVIREEATEDFFQMAGAGKDREILMKSSWDNASSRFPWLFASWIGGICAAFVIGLFDNTIKDTLALAAFIPVIIGMGGNIGTQTSTLVVRGLATGRVNVGNNLSIILKEIRVGIILGILYGLLLGLFAIIQFVEISPYLGLVVGMGIAGSMLIATAFGSLVPLLLQRLDVDPAIATGPFVTTSIDVLGVSLYLGIANIFLTV